MAKFFFLAEWCYTLDPVILSSTSAICVCPFGGHMSTLVTSQLVTMVTYNILQHATELSGISMTVQYRAVFK